MDINVWADSVSADPTAAPYKQRGTFEDDMDFGDFATPDPTWELEAFPQTVKSGETVPLKQPVYIQGLEDEKERLIPLEEKTSPKRRSKMYDALELTGKFFSGWELATLRASGTKNSLWESIDVLQHGEELSNIIAVTKLVQNNYTQRRLDMKAGLKRDAHRDSMKPQEEKIEGDVMATALEAVAVEKNVWAQDDD
ncbi:hypothetical protein BS50DRAFT_655867 [Corynespora cassiicola Philippines]|uniref:Uncharacterized protein n=1 Tax=Corynespora cassiicola Philippines TaxID=1448308 RepID=A0A2T2N496_CORCC|nr:hypothetical protein BS50DRAFT_655867 [Corynespora cassiicola Philippines]